MATFTEVPTTVPTASLIAQAKRILSEVFQKSMERSGFPKPPSRVLAEYGSAESFNLYTRLSQEFEVRYSPAWAGTMRGLRSCMVQMADDEWSSNTSMDKLAEEVLLADDGPPEYPLVVTVSEHAGWQLTYALIRGTVRVVSSANDRARFSDDAGWFRDKTYHLAFERELCSVIRRKSKKEKEETASDEVSNWECSDNPRDGRVYHCRSFTCPVHGKRNIEDAR